MVKAIQHLEQALDHLVGEPDATARATLARLYVRSGSYDKAISLLIDLVNQEPGWQEGPQLLVEAYASAGRNADAIQWLEQAVEGDPRLYATLADFFERDRRWKDAAGAFAEAVKASPRNPELKRRYASALLNGGGRQAVGIARDVLTDVLAARPNDARAPYLLSQAQRRSGTSRRRKPLPDPHRAERQESVGLLRALRGARRAPAVSGRCRYAVDRPRPVPIVSRERFVVRARSSAAASRLRVSGARSVRQGDCGVRRSTSLVAG
jgi:predicted Zn-dependent protease